MRHGKLGRIVERSMCFLHFNLLSYNSTQLNTLNSTKFSCSVYIIGIRSASNCFRLLFLFLFMFFFFYFRLYGGCFPFQSEKTYIYRYSWAIYMHTHIVRSLDSSRLSLSIRFDS